jgi:hypothetical protein
MYWKFEWFWGLPLLVITVVFHVVMFVLMEKTLVIKVGREEDARTLSHFIVAMALIALGAATLHGLEATAWAALYIWLGALPRSVRSQATAIPISSWKIGGDFSAQLRR